MPFIEATEGEPHSLLLIEGDALKRTSMLKSLAVELPGWKLIGAPSVKELDALAEPSAELVLFDVGCADTSDPAVQNEIALLRARYLEARLVIVCSADGDRCILGALRSGARAVFTTSTSIEMAIAGLRLVLAGGIYLPPSEPNCQQEEIRNPFELDDQGSAETVRPCTSELIGARRFAEGRSPFTAREADVLKELVQGRSNKIIAAQLGMSENTVKMHIQHIMRKLKVTNRTEAVVSWSRASQRSTSSMQMAS